MSRPTDRLCAALDGNDRSWILNTANTLSGNCGWLKVGLEAFTAFGPALVGEVAASGARVFLDLKLHDIPNTVRGAAKVCAASGAALFNVHASGGRPMMEAALEGAAGGAPAGSPRPRVIAVTVLTSLDRQVLDELGIHTEPAELVSRWAQLAQQAGLDGVVASAKEAAAVRAACGPEFLVVTPGIRPRWAAADDQRRIVTPGDAVAAGADILVVGRPITRAADPAEAAGRILEEIADDGSRGR